MDDLEPETRVRLIEAAAEAGRNAHAPFSNYHVGAALLTSDGRLFSGCNVENRSYGLTICAERGAVCAAMAEGAREFRWLTLVLPGAQPPCGACLQVLSEFCEQLPITLVDVGLLAVSDWRDLVRQPADEKAWWRTVRLEELLPVQFTFNPDPPNQS